CAAIVMPGWSYGLMALHGRIEISVQEGDGNMFVGVGSWGWKKAFRWDEVTSVYITRPHWIEKQPLSVGVVLLGREPLKFGEFPLSEERRIFVARVLATMLQSRSTRD